MAACRACETQLPERAKFCPECGARQPQPCAACGLELGPGARFCSDCGAAVPGPAAASPAAQPAAAPAAPVAGPQRPPGAAELRPVTVLFADVKGFTTMSETRDPDEVHELMQRLFGITDRHIAEQGGRIDKHIGDAVMALFGAQRWREDAPAQAIRAALRFQAEVQELADQLELEGYPRLSLRVGINTGRVLVGEVSAGALGETSVLGDAVNVAARLEGACPPGSVLISHETYRHVRGLFEVDAQPPIHLKGKREPVSTYLARSEKEACLHIGTREVLGYETDMIGRDEELAVLWDSFSRCMARRQPQLVTVLGSPGIGKSRLLFEMEKRLEAAPLHVVLLRGRAAPRTSGQPFGLIGQAIRTAAGLHDGQPTAQSRQRLLSWVEERLRERRSGGRRSSDREDAEAPRAAASAGPQPDGAAPAERVAHLAGELIGLPFPDSPHAGPLRQDPKRLRYQAFVAFERLFGHWARRAPLVLELEDVHWSDRSSLELLDHLLRSVKDVPLLAVVAGRPDLAEAHPGWSARVPHASTVSLQPLLPAQGRELAAHLLRAIQGLPDRLVEEVAQRSAGTPYFAEELVRSLADLGVLALDRDGLSFHPERLAPLAIPSTVDGLLQARLDRLSQEELSVARMASVVGRVFWDAALVALSRGAFSAAQVDEALLGLVARDIARAEPRSALAGCHQYSFVHDLMRDVAYRGLVRRTRSQLHGLAATWLEGRAEGNPTAWGSLLAEHWEQAGERERARTCYLTAARRAAAGFAHEEAERMYRAYLRLVDAPSPESVAARNELGEKVLLMRGRGEEAIAEHELAVGEARRLGERRLEAEGLRLQGFVYWRNGQMGPARQVYEHALDLARAVGDRRLEGMVTGNLGVMYTGLGRVEEERQLYEMALAIHREVGNRQFEGIVLGNVGALQLELGRVQEAWQPLEQALAIHREVGNRQFEGIVLGNLGFMHHEQGRLEEARQLYKQALDLASEVGDRRTEGYVLGFLGDLLRGDQGRSQERRRLYEDALAKHREAGNRRSEGSMLGNLGSLDFEQARMEQARQLLDQALAIHRELGNRRGEIWVLGELAGLSLIVERDAVEASRLAGESERLLQSMAHAPALDQLSLSVLCIRGHVALASGQDAAELLTQSRALAAADGARAASERGERLVKLERAQSARDAGQPLVRATVPRTCRPTRSGGCASTGPRSSRRRCWPGSRRTARCCRRRTASPDAGAGAESGRFHRPSHALGSSRLARCFLAGLLEGIANLV
ncbi:MAG: tetratricopeptide repeat protein [Candidatus Schekmanbacteria bacterium]|nr:tetratricopeptide repeat protein [Candidatus Schekmanbacteria bacterium]